jgi:hypothetical protein
MKLPLITASVLLYTALATALICYMAEPISRLF